MLLSHIIAKPESTQYWAVTINLKSYDNLKDGDFEVVAVSVYERHHFMADITEMLSKLNLLDKIIDGIDWLQEYAEKKSAEYEYQAEARREAIWNHKPNY